MTPLQQYCSRWENGCGNGICERRKSLVLGKGSVPCEVLMVGEAPGESEDAIGVPFVGPAGQELDRWIASAIQHLDLDATVPRVGFTNLLACLPRLEDGRKEIQPMPKEVKQCSQRLREFVLLCDGFTLNPNEFDLSEAEVMGWIGKIELIVAVGTQARDYLDVKRSGSVKLHRRIPMIHVLHPAYVLRQNTAQKMILAQRQVVVLKSALEEL